MLKGKILFQLSGSIACFKACQLLSRLVQDGFDVEVVATKAALNFVGEATLEGLTGKKVHTDTFAPGSYMDHIRLARWADLILLCPASANTLAKMSSGVGDDLVTTLFLAHDFQKPYLVAPAMNVQMLRHPATQASLQKLRAWGLKILDSGSGALACGETGEGRLMEPDDILRTIKAQLAEPATETSTDSATDSDSDSVVLSVLVTSGGTREPLDGVRAITNTSTGRTGAEIASYFTKRGHEVTLLRAEGSAKPAESTRERAFLTFSDLDQALREELSRGSYDAVIHAAAVSDYHVESIENGKKKYSQSELSKIESGDSLTIHLVRNPKLVDQLRSFARNPLLRVVAFKLTNTQNVSERQRAVQKLADHAKPDFIVHNDLREIDASGNRHVTTIYSATAGAVRPIAQASDKAQLATELESLLALSTGKEIPDGRVRKEKTYDSQP